MEYSVDWTDFGTYNLHLRHKSDYVGTNPVRRTAPQVVECCTERSEGKRP